MTPTAASRRSAERPIAVRLLMYRVGFGDCFLLEFEYRDRARHVLIDFGSTAPPPKFSSAPLVAVADDIAARCRGRLEAIVATHRHRDHISGFAGPSWKIIERLRPRLVVLPWTEHPDAATDATVAPSGTRGRIGALSCAHVRALSAMHGVAAAALAEFRARSGPRGRAGDAPEPRMAIAREITFIGEDNIANAEALRNLLSVRAQDFVSFGSRTRLTTLLPGLKVHVLGPPTLAQTTQIRAQRSWDPDEFWVRVMPGSGSARRRKGPLFPDAPTANAGMLPLEIRGFLRRLETVRDNELLELVRDLDTALNNTSVILLFEVLGKKLLFPGDAQIENWTHALANASVRALLAGVDVYKVGHHGSLNATPRSLWALFGKRGPAGRRDRLRSFLSTRPGKHGSAARGTEVPRHTLVEALSTDSDVHSTMDLRSRELVQVVPIA